MVSKVTTGKMVRVFVLDAGPDPGLLIPHRWHHLRPGHQEGIELKRGNAGGWGSQAVDPAPAQGVIVEVSGWAPSASSRQEMATQRTDSHPAKPESPLSCDPWGILAASDRATSGRRKT